MLPVADIDACDREPIRIPGAIQSHGHLLALDAQALTLRFWSANWGAVSSAATALAGLHHGRLRSLADGHASVPVGECLLDGRPLSGWAHRIGDTVIVEFEQRAPLPPLEAPLYELARDFLPQLQGVSEVQALLEIAVRELKRLTGFGRCLIYRFDPDGHGEVLAQALDAGYESYQGHHFPASDIPRQARELYLANRFRLIPDAGYRAVPLVATDPADPVDRLDLSMAYLRSVSPVHLEYMRNMGTAASMSVSIVVEGKLWGLASCHHHQPRFLVPELRAACSHLGQLLSMLVEAQAANAEVASRLALRKITLELVAHLSDSDPTLRGLVSEPTLLLRMAHATGAAVVLDDQAWTVGETPDPALLLELAAWVSHGGRDVYDVDQLATVFAGARSGQGAIAGMLALSISRVHRHVILWFRPEIVKTITWAGDPREKIIAGADGRLHPRRSFDSWVEQVGGRSRPWSAAEVNAVTELRQALIGIVLKRAEEVAAVVHELGKVNQELEAFSYTVSHDLRAPMRHIAGYVDLVLESEGSLLSPRSHRYLGHVKDASAFAGQLVDALLDFSRMGRSALKLREVRGEEMIASLIREFGRLESARDVVWKVEPGLPTLVADPVLLQVAARNLLANAVKYSRKREHPVVTVRPVARDGFAGIEVEDNGVGFQMQYVGKLFGVFQRLHKAEDFEGTGIGLANVKRIVERHGGSVWARGEPGVGATFGFLLPHKSDSFSAHPAPTSP
ncbi:GAF domain-containing protein [Xylophilus sp. Kf1]|nr:GAF domain-containing protein [Xylophilus sp. Kf1]